MYGAVRHRDRDWIVPDLFSIVIPLQDIVWDVHHRYREAEEKQ